MVRAEAVSIAPALKLIICGGVLSNDVAADDQAKNQSDKIFHLCVPCTTNVLQYVTKRESWWNTKKKFNHWRTAQEWPALVALMMRQTVGTVEKVTLLLIR